MDYLYLTVYVLVAIDGARSQTGYDAKALRTQLFVTEGYDKKIIPSFNQSEPKDVYLSFFLRRINGLDEVTETLKTTGYLMVTWFDNYLVWNSSDYGGIEYFLRPQDDVWKPDVTLHNSALDYEELGVSSLNVEVWNDGYVAWYPFQVFQSTCSLDIKNFPFDVQTCQFKFVAWSYTKAKVILSNGSKGIQLGYYQESTLWTIIGSSWSMEEDSSALSAITYTIQIKRKPMYSVFTVVIPIVLLALLNVFAFILPCESGERAGFAITVLLALAVFLSIISSTLPANSESVSIFSVYVITQLIQSTVIAFVALLTIRLSNKDTEVPRFLIKLYRFRYCKFCKSTKRNARVEPEGDTVVDNTFVMSVMNETDSNELNSLEKNQVNRTLKSKETCEKDKTLETVSWSMAVRAIDFILFVLFFSFLLTSTLFSLIAVATST